MLDTQAFADQVFGFLAQQALEKSLKAWLCALGEAFPFTHDLTDLLSRLDESGQDVGDLWGLAEFNPYAVELRYTHALPDDVPLDRPAAIELVESVVTRVQRVVGEA